VAEQTSQLSPYWSGVLNKNEMISHQLSERKGEDSGNLLPYFQSSTSEWQADYHDL